MNTRLEKPGDEAVPGGRVPVPNRVLVPVPPPIGRYRYRGTSTAGGAGEPRRLTVTSRLLECKDRLEILDRAPALNMQHSVTVGAYGCEIRHPRLGCGAERAQGHAVMRFDEVLAPRAV